MDFDLETYRPRILAILHAHRDALPWRGSLEGVEITPLGVGESNMMLHIALADQTPLAMRLAYCEDLADKYLPQEFYLLQRLPQGLGPQPFVLDMSRQTLPYPFALLSFVPGTPLVEYSEEILRVHAAKLARMHQLESATWTAREGRHRSACLDVSQTFQEGVADRRARNPELFEDELLIRLLPRLDDYFREYNHLFTALTRFSLIHGDLCASNILVHEGDVRYIDWEYARYGDGALDFAQLAWDIASPPWQIKFTAQQLAHFFQSYQELRPDPTLAERHAVWCVSIKFFDYLTHRRTALHPKAIQAFPSEHYHSIAQCLLDSLAGQFL